MCCARRADARWLDRDRCACAASRFGARAGILNDVLDTPRGIPASLRNCRPVPGDRIDRPGALHRVEDVTIVDVQCIAVIDFGGQYAHLIATKVRRARVLAEIRQPEDPIDEFRGYKGIILSGGPASIYEDHSPQIDRRILDLGLPILGICYGMQFMVHALGGKVKRSSKREYGFAEFRVKRSKPLFASVAAQTPCWMSHGDSIQRLPDGFTILGSTENTAVAAAANRKKHLVGVQFHPEVAHTPLGKKILQNFLFGVCGCKKSWSMKSFAREAIQDIRQTVGDKKVILGLSGGVDSSVTAMLLHQSIHKQLTCIFVDNGLLRLDEAAKLVPSGSVLALGGVTYRFPILPRIDRKVITYGQTAEADVSAAASIGPYCVIGPGVVLGAGTRLGPLVTLGGDVRVTPAPMAECSTASSRLNPIRPGGRTSASAPDQVRSPPFCTPCTARASPCRG